MWLPLHNTYLNTTISLAEREYLCAALGWVELIFSTVANMGLHFGFVLETEGSVLDNTGMF